MPSDMSDIIWTGDVTVAQGVKDDFTRWSSLIPDAEGFTQSLLRKLKMKEVAVCRRDKDGKPHSRVTFELVVDKDMVNLNGTMHGGCAVSLIDVGIGPRHAYSRFRFSPKVIYSCSSMALTVLALHMGKPEPYDLVSQALNTTFHAPAPLGVKIEIVNTTVSFGARTMSAATEIWDATNGRLCMTGVHSKMAPSRSKL